MRLARAQLQLKPPLKIATSLSTKRPERPMQSTHRLEPKVCVPSAQVSNGVKCLLACFRPLQCCQVPK